MDGWPKRQCHNKEEYTVEVVIASSHGISSRASKYTVTLLKAQTNPPPRLQILKGTMEMVEGYKAI